MANAFRVGDIVRDSSGDKGVIVEAEGGRYIMAGVGMLRGWRSSAWPASHYKMVKPNASAFELGDKVKHRFSGKQGEVWGTEKKGTKVTSVKVRTGKYGGFHENNNPMFWHVIKRKEDAKMTEIRVKIKSRRRGTKFAHSFAIDEIVTITDEVTVGGRGGAYIAVNDAGFEQVIDAGAFTPMIFTEEPKAPLIMPESSSNIYGLQVGKEYVAIKPWNHVTEGWSVWVDEVVTLTDAIQITGEAASVEFTNHGGEKFTVKAHNFARKFKLKEDDRMSGEWGGTPAVESDETTVLREELAKAKRALQEQRNQDFGEVTQRHLWDVIVDVPLKRFSYGVKETHRSTEVVTETDSIAEAAMVAEAMAKGVDEDAKVIKIVYQRVLGALK